MAKSSFINWENAPIKKEGFIAIFIFMSGLIGEGFYFYNRFITFHRYSINKNYWRIGFTEAVMGGYENLGSEEIGYIMPASILLETEENRGINANLLWLLDGMVKLQNWTIYSEFLVDDFALDKKSPPQIAFSAGIGKKINNLLINIEYTRVNRWTGNYCNSTPSYTMIEKNVPIGHSIGSDAQYLLINSIYTINKKLAIETSINWMENSGGNANERLLEWPDNVPCETNFGYNNEPFPSESHIIYHGEGKVNYLINNWILFDFGVSLAKNNHPIFRSKISFRLD